jgi:hypothetical protein
VRAILPERVIRFGDGGPKSVCSSRISPFRFLEIKDTTAVFVDSTDDERVPESVSSATIVCSDDWEVDLFRACEEDNKISNVGVEGSSGLGFSMPMELVSVRTRGIRLGGDIFRLTRPLDRGIVAEDSFTTLSLGVTRSTNALCGRIAPLCCAMPRGRLSSGADRGSTTFLDNFRSRLRGDVPFSTILKNWLIVMSGSSPPPLLRSALFLVSVGWKSVGYHFPRTWM